MALKLQQAARPEGSGEGERARIVRGVKGVSARGGGGTYHSKHKGVSGPFSDQRVMMREKKKSGVLSVFKFVEG